MNKTDVDVEAEVVREVHVVIDGKQYESGQIQDLLIELADARDDDPMGHKQEFGPVLDALEDAGIVAQTYEGMWVVADRSKLHLMMEEVGQKIADAHNSF